MGLASWFVTNDITKPPRQYGSFLFAITAKDPTAAARAAGTLVQRLQARAAYARGGSGSRLEPVGQVWIAGHPALPVAPPARGVDVLSLIRERTMYSTSSHDLLDDALEMAAPLNAGPPAPAVSGGWSAIESLLSQASDTAEGRPGRVVAADRLAAIVTCSWPRAELTALSYRHKPVVPDALSNLLEGLHKNLDRCRAVADALSAGQALTIRDPSDAAAALRMSAVLANPYKELADVRAVFESVLRRLYRQRNIVVHGARLRRSAWTQLCAPSRRWLALVSTGSCTQSSPRTSDHLNSLHAPPTRWNSSETTSVPPWSPCWSSWFARGQVPVLFMRLPRGLHDRKVPRVGHQHTSAALSRSRLERRLL
ncbi:hypothetical protein GCM10009835_34320 [Planosporangium flavigriseum]|uniref:Uncharacterized protein n=1 Tax=Planosporangium flavigriseum TaxID=373681 RepID=A0A8J3PKI7_9ACTN|nr:hypothetical protein Pfl04_12760 [Planosporangium flavigriseum]